MDWAQGYRHLAASFLDDLKRPKTDSTEVLTNYNLNQLKYALSFLSKRWLSDTSSSRVCEFSCDTELLEMKVLAMSKLNAVNTLNYTKEIRRIIDSSVARGLVYRASTSTESLHIDETTMEKDATYPFIAKR